MRDALIAAGALAGLVVALVLLRRRRASATDRRRAKAITEATHDRHGALNADDAAFVAEHAAVAEVWRTGEIPKVTEPRKPKVRDVVRRYRRTGKHSAKHVPRSRPRDLLTGRLTGPLEQPVMVPAKQPTHFELGEFTDAWNRSTVQKILADHKAGLR